MLPWLQRFIYFLKQAGITNTDIKSLNRDIFVEPFEVRHMWADRSAGPVWHMNPLSLDHEALALPMERLANVDTRSVFIAVTLFHNNY